MASQSVFIHFFLIWCLATTAFSQLSPTFYDYVCPQALSTIKCGVEEAVQKERRMGASLLRLHFHDCFVHGCDGSILLDPSPTIDSEKLARPNVNSTRGFDVIDQIKAEVDKVCGRPVVSCADILAVVARDSVVAVFFIMIFSLNVHYINVQLGGPTWEVELGRRDSTTAYLTLANTNIPSPFLDLPGLIQSFKNQNLDVGDLVALSGAHTIGFSRCVIYRSRIYNDTNIDPAFAQSLKYICPPTGGDSNLAPLDPTPARFDTAYYSDLLHSRGLLHSDQALFSGGSTDDLVTTYSYNPLAFFAAFAKSMVKMGNIEPLTGNQGQIRRNCRVVN
ncbi:LOW QUALITY PROTEIN: peroxidase domain-containing protein [Cephalotus follicularis]|uniref:Peroxidase n=1 Tax=Cephalotus follicularis TaxID=3775 RepID=A0A1Q3C385_CEPFO|nr:LOW QUALITY PROTEIN: peroxidase domain-containing protein [Cephalotus follicularis]